MALGGRRGARRLGAAVATVYEELPEVLQRPKGDTGGDRLLIACSLGCHLNEDSLFARAGERRDDLPVVACEAGEEAAVP